MNQRRDILSYFQCICYFLYYIFVLFSLYVIFNTFLSYFLYIFQEEQRRAEEADHTLTAHDKAERERMRAHQMAEMAAFSREEADGLGDDPTLKGAHWSEKARDIQLRRCCFLMFRCISFMFAKI